MTAPPDEKRPAERGGGCDVLDNWKLGIASFRPQWPLESDGASQTEQPGVSLKNTERLDGTWMVQRV